jgi:glycosyltransferase involved in cell wall biosynthesis
MTEKGPVVAVCIPAFNEEATIARVVLMAERYANLVLICDDGSTDMTGIIAEALGADVVLHETNLGYGAALQSLFEEAGKRGVDVAVTLDADGQDDPSEIPKLLKRLSLGDVDIVIGSRFLEGGGSEVPEGRVAGIQAITEIVANAGVKVTDAQSGFRAYNRHALETLKLSELGMGVGTEILVKAGSQGLKVAEVPIRVSYEEEPAKETPVLQEKGVLPTTLKYLSINRPLLFFGLPGLVLTVASTVFWGLTLYTYGETGVISLSMVVATLGATFIGLSLLTTGIILWVIKSVVGEKP